MSYRGQTHLLLPRVFVNKLPAATANDTKGLDSYIAKELNSRLRKAALGQPLEGLLDSCIQLTGLATRMNDLSLHLKQPAPTEADDGDLAQQIHDSHIEALRGLQMMRDTVGRIENHIADFLQVASSDELSKLHADANDAVTRTFCKLDEATELGPNHTLSLLLVVMDAVSPLPSRQADLLMRLAEDQKKISAHRMIGVPHDRTEIMTKDLVATGTPANPDLGDQTKTIEHLATILGSSANKVGLALLDVGDQLEEVQAPMRSRALCLSAEKIIEAHTLVHDFFAEAVHQRQATPARPDHHSMLKRAEDSACQLEIGLERVLQYIAGASWIYSADSIAALDPLLANAKCSVAERLSATPEHRSLVAFLQSFGVIAAQPQKESSCTKNPVMHQNSGPGADEHIDIDQTQLDSDLTQLFRTYQHLNQLANGKLPNQKDGAILTDAKGIALTREQLEPNAEFVRKPLGPGTIGEWQIPNSEKPKKSVAITGPGEKFLVWPYRMVGPHIILRQNSDRIKYRLLKISDECFRVEHKKNGGKFREELQNRQTKELAKLEWDRQLRETNATEIKPNFKHSKSILNSLNSALLGLDVLGYQFQPEKSPPPVAAGLTPANDPVARRILWLRQPRSAKARSQQRKASLLKRAQVAKIPVDLVQIVLEARALVRAQHREHLRSVEKLSPEVQPTTKAPEIVAPRESMLKPEDVTTDVHKADFKQASTSQHPSSTEIHIRDPIAHRTVSPVKPEMSTQEPASEPRHQALLDSTIPNVITPAGGGSLKVTPTPVPTEVLRTANPPLGVPLAGEAQTAVVPVDAIEATGQTLALPVAVAASTDTQATNIEQEQSSAPAAPQAPSESKKQSVNIPADKAAEPTDKPSTDHIETVLGSQYQGQLGSIVPDATVPGNADATKDSTTTVSDQTRRAQDEPASISVTEFCLVSAPLANPARPAIPAEETPGPAADLRSSQAPGSDFHEAPVLNIGDGNTAPVDADTAPQTQFGISKDPDSDITSNVRSAPPPPRSGPGDERWIQPSASESRPTPSANRATENPERVESHVRLEAIIPALDHRSPSLPELTYYVPETLIDAAEEAARSGGIGLLQDPLQAADFLANIGWPLAASSKAPRENELILRHCGGPVHLRLDETLFVVQLALARGRMRAYPTWNFHLRPILSQDEDCRIEHGAGGFLNPFHNDLFELEKKLKDALFAACWMFQSKHLDYAQSPLEIAAGFWMKFNRAQPELAVLLTGLHYRTNKHGYLNFDSALRKMCYRFLPLPNYITRKAMRMAA